MNADERRFLTERILAAVFEVSNTLGAGFLEKVYERALLKELSLRGLQAQSQVPVEISYKGILAGRYFADMVVEDEVVLELKCVEAFTSDHMAQCLNYLRASGKPLALLINFQHPKVQLRRVIHEHPRSSAAQA